MTDIRPVVVFPEASTRGGVERVALETLLFLAPRYATTFVGHTLGTNGAETPIRHLIPRPPAWAVGSLRPAGFRVSAARFIPSERGHLTISHGVNAPPGDVYHVHSLHRAWLNASRSVKVRNISVPGAVRYLLPRHQVLLALEWDYFCRHRPRRVVAVSQALAEDIHHYYRVPEDVITIIPNGFDPNQCNPERRAALRAQRRAEAGINDDAVVLLFVANELHRKGLGVLLDAVARVDDERVQVHIVGRTPLDKFMAQTNSLGITGQVRYHGATADVGLFHALADLLVLPTQYETFAIAVLEALASGLPVIVPKGMPGTGERVANDLNGLLLDDPFDVEELALQIGVALDAGRRARWSAAAPSSVADLDWPSLMLQLENVIREVA